MERDLDALMRRTEKRPLPTGRLLPFEALWFGLGLMTKTVIATGIAIVITMAGTEGITTVAMVTQSTT